MKQRPGFCYEIFKNLAFWSHNTTVGYSPCSLYRGLVAEDVTPTEAWHSAGRRRVIELISQDQRLPGCDTCYREEAAGRTSRRQSSRDSYEQYHQSHEIDADTTGPEGLDYSVGNLCNLRCVICGPHNSSAWIPDHQKIYPDQDITKYLYRKQQIMEIHDDDFLANVKSLHFHGGGEPLMSDAHEKLLERIKKVRGLADLRVFYNTNATQTVSDRVLELWSQCRLVEIYFSIDDVGDRFEYQRTGAHWAQTQEVLQWFRDHMPHNHMFKINCVWSYLNLYYLNEIEDWHREHFACNRYGDACELLFQKALGTFAVQHLSPAAMQELQARFSQRPRLLQLLSGIEINDQDHVGFWQTISAIDRVRDGDFRTLCPEWSALL